MKITTSKSYEVEETQCDYCDCIEGYMNQCEVCGKDICDDHSIREGNSFVCREDEICKQYIPKLKIRNRNMEELEEEFEYKLRKNIEHYDNELKDLQKHRYKTIKNNGVDEGEVIQRLFDGNYCDDNCPFKGGGGMIVEIYCNLFDYPQRIYREGDSVKLLRTECCIKNMYGLGDE